MPRITDVGLELCLPPTSLFSLPLCCPDELRQEAKQPQTSSPNAVLSQGKGEAVSRIKFEIYTNTLAEMALMIESKWWSSII